MNYFCWSVLVLWLGMAGIAGAQPELDAGQLERNAERSRISAERRKLEAGHSAAEAVCYRTFFANACRDKLRPAHTAALADLRRQEVLISEVERKISAADQLLKTEEKLMLQRQQQPEQAVKVQQDIASQLERVKQREAEQGDATDQAAANRASLGLRQANSENNALELVRKRAQAAGNVEAARLRQETAAKNRADSELRLRQNGSPTGKSLPAYP